MATRLAAALSDRRDDGELATVAELRPAADDAFDRDYWLTHCEGFRVDGREGRIGFVEEVRRERGRDDDPLLAVRAGLLGRRLLLFRASDAAFIVPQAKRIWLRSSAAITGSEPAAAAPPVVH
jgi:hypothetical protein